ncbi:MAG: hypothetical protein KatS3mg043_1814 [Rhodothermaceae bacterium]|nr:MAG: hypothetical protein KatS3mg043_1814 [Rhodothermaceae bacterium]
MIEPDSKSRVRAHVSGGTPITLCTRCTCRSPFRPGRRVPSSNTPSRSLCLRISGGGMKASFGPLGRSWRNSRMNPNFLSPIISSMPVNGFSAINVFGCVNNTCRSGAPPARTQRHPRKTQPGKKIEIRTGSCEANHAVDRLPALWRGEACRVPGCPSDPVVLREPITALPLATRRAHLLGNNAKRTRHGFSSKDRGDVVRSSHAGPGNPPEKAP